MNHSREYYRKMRKKHINRKKRIIKNTRCWYYKHEGTLSKGKIHCSCPYCNEKNLTHRHLITNQEIRSNDSISDYIKDTDSKVNLNQIL